MLLESGMWLFTSPRHEAFYTNNFTEMKLYLRRIAGIPLKSLHEAIKEMAVYNHNVAEFGFIHGLLLFTKKEDDIMGLIRLNN
jgi:hypothetical protein